LRLRARGDDLGPDELGITGVEGARARWADLELPNGQVVELIEYLTPRGTPVALSPNDPGATHISLRVDDVDALHARLRDAGVSVRSEPVTLSDAGAWNGARCFYASDPDRVTVELIQR
jgi:catechol 2,3-dioxygenase-like lactoylglutathione lyase family enzyme